MSYVELSEFENSLQIQLTEAGREELQAQRDNMGWKRGTLYIFQDLLEDWLCKASEPSRRRNVGISITCGPKQAILVSLPWTGNGLRAASTISSEPWKLSRKNFMTI